MQRQAPWEAWSQCTHSNPSSTILCNRILIVPFSMCRAVTYPLVSVSTRAQVETKKPEHAGESLISVLRRIIAQEGVSSLYSGLESSLMGIAVTNGVYYLFFEESRAFLLRTKSKTQGVAVSTLSTLESIIASFVAGCATSLITNPMLVQALLQAIYVFTDLTD